MIYNQLLHVLAPRCHPQGVIYNKCTYASQHANQISPPPPPPYRNDYNPISNLYFFLYYMEYAHKHWS